MKPRSLAILLTGIFISTLPLAAQTNNLVIFPDEDALAPGNLKLVWSATPGLRYEVQQSTNLQTWTTAPGFPAPADGPAQQMPFAADGNARFFQVRQLDEQPPEIVNQYPQDGGFAVPRFSNLTLQLSDVTGIDTNSIRLTVGNLGTFWLTNSQLTFSNNLLTFINGGSIPLGGWGSNIQATLIVADTFGNVGTNAWSFSLETQPQVVTNLFVFGSPQAQRTGQRIGNIPTAALAARFGPIPMGDGDPWTLELVESNRLVVSYTNTVPGFATNTYVCNLTPVSPGDIFNRKITSITDDPGNKRLTLFTIEVPLTEIATNGAASISSSSMILQTGTNGTFVKAFSIDGTITFPRIGYSLDGAEFKLKDTASDIDIVNLELEEEHWWLTPRLQVGLEVNWGELKRFEAIASGKIESASVWNVDFLLAGVALEKAFFDLPEALEPKTWMFLGSIGPVPVYASLGLDVKVKGRAEVHATVNFRAGKRETADAAFGLTYNKPNVQWVNTFNFPPPEVIPFSANINAEGSLKVSLEPALEFLVYGLAGVSAGITPSAGIVFEIGTGQPLSGRLEADVTLDLGLAGPAFELLNPKPELSLPLWHDEWHLFPDEAAISFTLQPQSKTVQLGGSAYFSCTVAASGTPAYQWYFNGVPMPGQNARTLLLPSVSYGHTGNYHVRVTAGSQTANSSPATLTVVTASVPAGMALIPAGSFTMGDSFNDGPSYERPMHDVYVSAFYMDRYEVTKALWDDVYNWAIGHGYSFDSAGSGKAANHPVHTISWYDCVKWCNARSEKAGLTPAYYTSAALATVYRSGRAIVQNDWVNWNSGYRLPTEAEWEKAARGGASGHRFPWSDSDTIDRNRANYFSQRGCAYSSSPCISYDLSPTQGSDLRFRSDGDSGTSPVGYFAPNGYGLYDMTGNVYEWCWDSWDAAWYSNAWATQRDTRGPTGPYYYRVLRSGGWTLDSFGNEGRCASRSSVNQEIALGEGGFRCVQGLPSQPPSGMATIPAGSFTMGNALDPNEGWSAELPLHSVYVSAFFIDKYDVTKALWESVYQWATNHGYSFDYYGATGKTANHPALYMTWYDAVKWSNARSELEGLNPCYYTSAAQTVVYRGGQNNLTNDCVKWAAAGYRLPTEAEWEKAARGGAGGQRFPWGNTISWSQANYYAYPFSAGGYAYDVNPTPGYHPTFNDGISPYTSPVGYFAPNGYGLYDMAGNVWQWCWDRWDGSWYSNVGATQSDTRGPGGDLSERVWRGGGSFPAMNSRCAGRFNVPPNTATSFSGFRCVRAP